MALIQHDWCSRKGRENHWDAYTQRGDYRRTQGEGGRLQEERRPPEKSNLLAPVLGLPASRTMKFLQFKPPRLWF